MGRKPKTEWLKGYDEMYSCNSKGEFFTHMRESGPHSLAVSTQKNGYKTVRLFKYKGLNEYEGQTKLAHRLLWETFIGDIPENKSIIFKNGNKEDLSLSNLKMVNRGKEPRPGAPKPVVFEKTLNSGKVYFNSVSEAAKWLKVDNATIKHLAKTGKVYGLKVKYL